MTHAADARTRRPAAAIFVVVTVAIDAMGIGLIMPVMPDLMRDLAAMSLSDAALWGGYLTFSYAAMQFLFGPLIGSLSDRFGRRPVLLASLAAMAADYLVMAVAGSLWLLFAARAMSGIAGATHSTANAYMADVSPREKRAANFGLVGAGFGIGFIFGPAIGGMLGELGPRAPFYAAAALAAANCLYGFLVLPESLPAARRRHVDWRRVDPFSALRKAVRLPGLGALLATTFVYNFAHYVYPSVWSYFTLEAFNWSVGEVGLSLAVFGALMALVQGGAIRIVLARIGAARTVGLGLTANLAVMLALAFATEGWMVYALMPLMALSVVTGPALTGLMSALAPDDAQGELQGVIAALAGVSTILSPLLMTRVFNIFTGPDAPVYLPGAPFLAAAALFALSAGLFMRSRSRHSKR